MARPRFGAQNSQKSFLRNESRSCFKAPFLIGPAKAEKKPPALFGPTALKQKAVGKELTHGSGFYGNFRLPPRRWVNCPRARPPPIPIPASQVISYITVHSLSSAINVNLFLYRGICPCQGKIVPIETTRMLLPVEDLLYFFGEGLHGEGLLDKTVTPTLQYFCGFTVNAETA